VCKSERGKERHQRASHPTPRGAKNAYKLARTQEKRLLRKKVSQLDEEVLIETTTIRNEVYVGMSELNFPTKLIRRTKETLTIVTCCVKIQNDCSESFENQQELRQEDVFSTLLFNVVLEFIVRRRASKLTNNRHEIDKEFNSPNAINFTKTSRLRYAGYMIRTKPNGRRNQARPKSR
jgi:hypothetical protein